MAGASKGRVKAERQAGKAILSTGEIVPGTADAIMPSNNPLSFDGPCDDRYMQDRPSHGFGPTLGYDPARDNPGSKPVVPSRLELPSAAFQSYNPPTTLPKRPFYDSKDAAPGRDIEVRVNQFRVKKWTKDTVYQYDVHIGKGDEKRGFISAVWNSQSMQAKLQETDKMWLFDGNKIAWALNTPSNQRQEIRHEVDMDKERGRPPKVNKGNKEADPLRNVIKVRVTLVGKINMAVIRAYLDKKMIFDNTVLQAINFLDHCMRQMPTQYYTQIKRSFFHHGNQRFNLDLGVVEAMKGVYSSMRLCQGDSGLGVNVDVANGTFWIAQDLHQAARNLCALGKSRNPKYDEFKNWVAPVRMPDGNWTQSDSFKTLRKMAKLRFTVKHRGKEGASKIYTIKGFCFDPKWGPQGGNAKNVKFLQRKPNGETEEISVHDYFRKQYSIDLLFHYLPLVKTEKDGTFPMEVCHLLENQQYKYKTDPDQTANMIKFAVTRPKERIRAVEFGVSMLKWHEDPYLKHYGIEIEKTMTVTKARLLRNPEVLFSGGKLNPGTTGRWDLRGKKFFAPNPEPLQSWGICVVNGVVDQATVNNFVKVLTQIYTGHGGKFAKNSQPYIMAGDRNKSPADTAAELYQNTGNKFQKTPQILMWILPDKNAQTYERLKRNMECRYGIVSQMVQASHVRNAQPQYCSNVSMKINAKLGGSTSRVALKTPTSKSDFFTDYSTMIIGADVSHPSPGSPQGSTAALTMSMDKHASRYAAAVQTNGHRVEMITTANIRSMMMPLFDHWVKTVGQGKPPGHIYYFRDGVSEGQFEHVLQQEVHDMKNAIKEKYPTAIVKFTVTVASKRHHLRFFPKEGDTMSGDKNGNALPGTLVEHDITHPFEYDFYLCSHSAIQGTARPTHYHVLMDEAGIAPKVFQQMVYQHCYQFMRSTTPVSLYPAVYYAHIASLRSRAHENAPASGPVRGGAKFVEQQQDAAIAAAHMNRAPPSVKSSMDMHTEVLPLTALGAGLANGRPDKYNILTSMWYI